MLELTNECISFYANSSFFTRYHTVISYFNACVCLLIAVRLMTYQRDGAKHKPLVSMLSWFLAASMLCNALMTFTGKYVFVPPVEVIPNTIIAILIYVRKGNLARILHG